MSVTETSQKAVFEEPPKKKQGRPDNVPSGVWVTRLQKPFKSPGRWCRVWESPDHQHAAETARNIKSGRVRVPEGGTWAATARTVETDESKDGQKHHYVYAMFEAT